MKEFFQAVIVALVGTGAPLLVVVGILAFVAWAIARMPKSSNEAIRKFHEVLTGMREAVKEHDRKQDAMHAEFREAHGRIEHSVDGLTDKVEVLAERVARHDGILERLCK